MTRQGLRTMRPARAAGPVLDLAERPFVGETHSNPPGTSRLAECGERRPQGAFDTVIHPATASPVAAPQTLPPCLRPMAPLYLPCAASGVTPDRLRARRKPRSLERYVGSCV